jgi:hypothetical protein
MQLRRQAGDVDVAKVERKHFARQSAASDDQNATRPAGGRAVHRLSINILYAFRLRRLFSPREKVAR